VTAARNVDEKKESKNPGSAAVTLPDCDYGSWFAAITNDQPRSDRLQVINAEKGAGMGDKGGKKDKEKNKQQQLTKHKQEDQKKHDKAPAKKSAAGTA
jgi:hypothetical protein